MRFRLLTIAAFASAQVLATIPAMAAATAQPIASVRTLVGLAAPDFTLGDQNGHAFTLSGQRGHVTILFFGYTHCPDICPTSLATIASVIRQLGSDADKQVRVAFITDDPTRDTPQTLRRYVTLFDPSFLGLVGTSSQMGPVYKAYHVWFTRLPNRGSAAGYLLAHSSFMYLISKDGVVRYVHDWRDDRSSIARDLRKLYL
jgi:protein SCO1/2